MTLTVTQETIQGKPYTVLWHDDSIESFNGTMTSTYHGYVWHLGDKLVATVLRALPKYPKPEDAPLLYAYLAHGLTVCGNVGKHKYAVQNAICFMDTVYDPYMSKEITHCTDADGHPVEVAIEGE